MFCRWENSRRNKCHPVNSSKARPQTRSLDSLFSALSVVTNAVRPHHWTPKPPRVHSATPGSRGPLSHKKESQWHLECWDSRGGRCTHSENDIRVLSLPQSQCDLQVLVSSPVSKGRVFEMISKGPVQTYLSLPPSLSTRSFIILVNCCFWPSLSVQFHSKQSWVDRLCH